jgi:hypothetical protein
MSAGAVPARTIFIIRHGEKPGDPPPPNGVDVNGDRDDHSLAPVGWQRAGGLVRLFAPFGEVGRKGIVTPGELFSPGYGSLEKTAAERTYQTILPLSQLLKLTIDNSYSESKKAAPSDPDYPGGSDDADAGHEADDAGQAGKHVVQTEAQLGAAVAAATAGTTLICWEHTAIAEIANAITPVATGTVIPQTWPDDRYDVVWSFARKAGSTDPYVFHQIPEMLLSVDLDAPIPSG